MPELPPEVAAQIDGEGDLDLVIQQQVIDDSAGRPRRAIPVEFIDRVHNALEYTMRRQGLQEDDCRHRRRCTEEWLDHLRGGDHWDDWCRTSGIRHQRVERTPEEDAAAEAAYQVAQAERSAKEAAANQRAEAILRSSLSPKQLKELDRRGYFHVVTGARRFRITRGRSHNVKEVDARSRIRRTFCAHPIEYVPDADTMLAQKLWLETRPKEFFKLANVLRARPRARLLHGVGQPIVNRRGIERLAMHAAGGIRDALDATAATRLLMPAEEVQAQQEAQEAEEVMAIFEQAALDATAGVAAVEPEPVADGSVRAA